MAEVKFDKWKYKAENAKNCPFCDNSSISVMHKQKQFMGYNGLGFKKIEMTAYCMCNKCYAKGTPVPYVAYTNCNHSYFDENHLPLYSCGDKAIEAWNRRTE